MRPSRAKYTVRVKLIPTFKSVCLSIICRLPNINRNFGSLLFLGATKRSSFFLEFVYLTIYSTHCHRSSFIKIQTSSFFKEGERMFQNCQAIRIFLYSGHVVQMNVRLQSAAQTFICHTLNYEQQSVIWTNIFMCLTVFCGQEGCHQKNDDFTPHC